MRWTTLLAALLVVLACWSLPAAAATSDGDVTSSASSGQVITTDTWRAIRQGEAGFINGQPAQRGQLIQSEGEAWRAARNGVLAWYAGLALVGVVLAIGAFYLIRGKIMIEGRLVHRAGPVRSQHAVRPLAAGADHRQIAVRVADLGRQVAAQYRRFRVHRRHVHDLRAVGQGQSVGPL
jgi:hypothetical protein